MKFQGFSEQTIDFLWGIRFNNHREWFLDHKQDYLDHVYEPLKALGAELMEGMESILPEEPLQLKVARVYRDARRVKYGGLYKDHLWLVIRHPGEDWTGKPAFYVEISPEGYEYGMGYWCAKPVLMEQYRRRVLREPEALIRLARRMNAQEVFQLDGELYKRSKGTVDPLIQPWFDRKSIVIRHFSAPDERMLSPELAGEILAGFRWLKPWFEYFKALELEPPVT